MTYSLKVILQVLHMFVCSYASASVCMYDCADVSAILCESTNVHVYMRKTASVCKYMCARNCAYV